MEARHYKITLYAFFLGMVLLFALWPPEQGHSQDKSIDVESKENSLAEAIQKVDSLNHVLKVEIDLREYQNRTDTVINSQVNRKQ